MHSAICHGAWQYDILYTVYRYCTVVVTANILRWCHADDILRDDENSYGVCIQNLHRYEILNADVRISMIMMTSILLVNRDCRRSCYESIPVDVATVDKTNLYVIYVICIRRMHSVHTRTKYVMLMSGFRWSWWRQDTSCEQNAHRAQWAPSLPGMAHVKFTCPTGQYELQVEPY